MKSKIKIALLLSGMIIFILLPTTPARAGWWGEPTAAALLKQALEEIYDTIQGFIRGTAKQLAAESLNTLVGSIISGGSGGPLFITDWDDFLVQAPYRRTDIYMNDFFTITTRGRASSLNYTASRLFREGIQNYESYLVAQARRSILEATRPVTDLNEYVGDPSQMFSTGNWRAFNSFISNPANNVFGFTLLAQDNYMRQLEEERRKAEIQAIAYQGYMAQEQEGQVLTPGSTIKDIQSQVSDLGNKIIASAQSLPEIITAVATRLVTQTINQGIGQIQRKINRGINSTIGRAANEVNRVMNSGPGQIFIPRY